MRTWLAGVLLAILAALGAGAGLAAAEEDAEPSPRDAGFRKWFFAKNGLDKLRDALTFYPVSLRDDLAHAATLSTKDYLLMSIHTKTGMLAKPEANGIGDNHFCSGLMSEYPSIGGGFYYLDHWKVVDVTPAHYGAVAAELTVFACPDNCSMIEEYRGHWDCLSQLGFDQYLARFKRNDALRLGDLALCSRILKLEEKDGVARFVIDYSRWKNPQDAPPGITVPEKIHIDFFRNGVVVMAWGKDSGNFRYLRFLRDLDALLCHDGAGPAPAPGALSPDEYRQGVEKYRAWREEEAKKESERRERELAQERAEAARRQAERAPAPGEPREVVSEDRACSAPRAKKAPREGRHWLWRLFMGCGCPPRAGE